MGSSEPSFEIFVVKDSHLWFFWCKVPFLTFLSLTILPDEVGILLVALVSFLNLMRKCGDRISFQEAVKGGLPAHPVKKEGDSICWLEY